MKAKTTRSQEMKVAQLKAEIRGMRLARKDWVKECRLARRASDILYWKKEVRILTKDLDKAIAQLEKVKSL